MKNEIKELNKKKVRAIAVVLLLAFIIAANYFISNKQEWTKYSGHPDNTFVTKKELEIQKQTIYDESKQLILDTISNENVVKQLDYLNKQKLSDDNQLKYGNIQKTYTSFDESKDYTLDEIIALTDDYLKLVDDLDSLYTEVKETELTKAINDSEKEVKKHQDGISKLTLTDSEQKEFDKQIKLYNAVKFSKETTYTIDELENIKVTFTDINKQLESLSKKAKDRIATEQSEAEKQLAQANIYNQSSGYTEGNYNSNTSSNNENTSNVGSVSNQPKPKVCPYASLEAAVAAGEASGRGYSAGNCGDNSFELRLFDGDNTGNNNGWNPDWMNDMLD